MNNMTITEDLLAEIEEAAIQTYQDEWYQDGPDIFTDTREQHCCGIPSGGECCGVPDVDGSEIDDICRPSYASVSRHIIAIQPRNALALIARIRQLESVLREADTYLDISAIHTGSVLHETMRAALGDQP